MNEEKRVKRADSASLERIETWSALQRTEKKGKSTSWGVEKETTKLGDVLKRNSSIRVSR